MNSTAAGPFLPLYYKGKWTDIYIEGLQGNVQLFGSTINTCEQPLHVSHVQSYIFSMKKITVQMLIITGIFSLTDYVGDRQEAINMREIRMSRIVLHFGGNIGCLMKCYEGVDFTFRDKKPSDYEIPFMNDLMMIEFMDKGLWNKYELVFVKGNRV